MTTILSVPSVFQLNVIQVRAILTVLDKEYIPHDVHGTVVREALREMQRWADAIDGGGFAPHAY